MSGAASSRVRPIDAMAALYAAAFFAWIAVRTPGTPVARFIGVAAFVPIGLAVAWANWNNARLAGLDLRTRIGWRLLALSALALYVTGTAWDLFLLAVGDSAAPAWTDQLELVNNLLGIAAILVFPARRLAERRRGRFLLDASLTVIAGFVLALYFGFRLWFTELQGESLASAVVGPGVDLAVFVAAALGSIQKRDAGTRTALACLVLAAISYLAANYYYSVASFGPHAQGYQPGDSVDALWFGAWVLRWLGARLARARYLRDQRPAPVGDQEEAVVGYERSAFSYLLVACAFFVLTAEVLGGDERFLGVVTACAALMIGLLLARQVLELRDNDRLFAERSLQEARFRSFVQHSSDVVLIVDSVGTITFASPSAARVLGEHTPVRPGASLVDLVREDDRPALAPLLAGSTDGRRLTFHLPTGDRGWRDIEALWSDLRGDTSVGGIVVNCRDVTARNELERQLRHSQKLDAVGHLAGGLAHDLNNVLAIIGGYAELLRGEIDPGSRAADDLTHIRLAVDRAATITRKVLAFSRSQPVMRTVVNVNGVVRDLAPILRQSVKGKGEVEVRLCLADDLWTVRADQGQLEQVLLNLTTNARDAMPRGGVVEIATANRRIDASGADAGLAPGDYVSIVVKDTGAGMSADVLDRIFEPFFSTKTKDGGMGLGLAMVRNIVRESGGRVLAESEPGRGSSFTILLPRTNAPVAREQTDGEALELAVGPQTVLLVDDEESIRKVARRILENRGYHVIEAAGGEEALEVIRDPTRHLDVLLTDLVMPGIGGRQLMALCADERPSLPVICLTGYAGEADDPRQYGENLVALLSKPFSSDVLARTVATAVGRRSLS